MADLDRRSSRACSLLLVALLLVVPTDFEFSPPLHWCASGDKWFRLQSLAGLHIHVSTFSTVTFSVTIIDTYTHDRRHAPYFFLFVHLFSRRRHHRLPFLTLTTTKGSFRFLAITKFAETVNLRSREYDGCVRSQNPDVTSLWPHCVVTSEVTVTSLWPHCDLTVTSHDFFPKSFLAKVGLLELICLLLSKCIVVLVHAKFTSKLSLSSCCFNNTMQ